MESEQASDSEKEREREREREREAVLLQSFACRGTLHIRRRTPRGPCSGHIPEVVDGRTIARKAISRPVDQ